MTKKPKPMPHNMFNTMNTEAQVREVSFISPTHAVCVKSCYKTDSLGSLKRHALDVLNKIRREK